MLQLLHIFIYKYNVIMKLILYKNYIKYTIICYYKINIT